MLGVFTFLGHSIYPLQDHPIKL